MDLEYFLISIGVNISSNFIYEKVNDFITNNKSPTTKELTEYLSNELNIENAYITSEKIISFFAEKGIIEIKGTHIYAAKRIEFTSSTGQTITFGENSISETKTTKMETKGNAKMVAKGNARIVQNDEDGSISFYT